MTNSRSGFISIGNEKLHYLKNGAGKRILLAFHGYGDDATTFEPIEEYLEDKCTTLSFDLPHHGESTWGDTPLTKTDMAQLVETVKKEYSVEKVSLLGYSLGGRVCLTIVEQAPESIERVTLVATDGLVENHYYHFFTRNYFGKKMFRNMLEKPARYFMVMGWLHKAGLVNASRYKFAMHSLSSEESRERLLKVWPGMSSLVPILATLKAAIKEYRIPVIIFMGANDKIMPPALAEKFKKGLDTVKLFILDKGHRILDHENAGQIAQTLL